MRAASCPLAARDSPAAEVSSSRARFLSYFVGFLDSTGTSRKGRKRRKKAIKIKAKMQGAACGEPVKRRVSVPSDAVSSCPPSSPVGRCERGEQRERCEDARRWNNEFIAACHPHLLKGCFGVFLKLLRHFKSLPASFSRAFLSLGRKLLPQVFPLCTLVRSSLADLHPPAKGFPLPARPLALRSSCVPPATPGFFPPHSRSLSAGTHAGFGLRVTNFSQSPAEGPDSWRAAGASWRVA